MIISTRVLKAHALLAIDIWRTILPTSALTSAMDMAAAAKLRAMDTSNGAFNGPVGSQDGAQHGGAQRCSSGSAGRGKLSI